MPGNVIKVLLIEDNLGDARLFGEYLSESDGKCFRVEHCDRLSNGLQRLRHTEIDVLLLDLSLPDSTGMDTVIRVRAEAPDVPIVVLTGLEDEQVAIQAVKHGAQDFLFKNRVDAESLVRSIRYAIQRHKIQQGIREVRKKRDTGELRAVETAPGSQAPNVEAGSFGPRVLDESYLHRLAERLSGIIAAAAGPRMAVSGTSISSQLRDFAHTMGELKAGPRDLMDVYERCLRRELAGAGEKERQAYLRAGPSVALEAMGHLASYYRCLLDDE